MDLSTRYMTLDLPTPIIVGACGLTNTTESIARLAQAGAGAVVLKSLFEEQIMVETDRTYAESAFHPEAADYLDYFVREDNLRTYLQLIRDAKQAVSIPVIASIACITSENWTHFAEEIEAAGADGIELNVFLLPSDTKVESGMTERAALDIISAVRKRVSIPIALKVSHYYSNLACALQKFSHAGIAGLVLFNRFYAPDIDIEKQELVPGTPYSSPSDMAMTLRWVAIMAGKVKCDLAASTGIHSGEGVIKQLLAGARAVQIASSVYQQGPEAISKDIATIEDWMTRHHYGSVNGFVGKLSQSHIQNPAFYERVQFMAHFGQV